MEKTTIIELLLVSAGFNVWQYFRHREWRQWVTVMMGEATAARLGLRPDLIAEADPGSRPKQTTDCLS